MAEQRGAAGEVLGFEKQLAERRVRQIIGRCRQHDLRVAGDVDLTNSRALVDDGHAPHFDVVFRGDGDVELRGDLVVVPAERRSLRPELDGVLVRFRGRRMIGGRPHGAASHVAQVDELTARIPRGVSARLRHGEPAPEAGASAAVRHDRDVVAVRQELGVRKHGVRRSVLPHRNRRRRGDDAHFVQRPWLNRRRMTRHALLEEQFGGLHARLRMKALHHPVAEKSIGDGDQRHARVMGHVRADDRSGRRECRARRRYIGIGFTHRVVDGVKEAVVALETGGRQPSQIGGALPGSIITASAVA